MLGQRDLLIGAACLIAAIGAAVLVRQYRKPFILRGAVVQANDDPSRQAPIADVQVSASDGAAPNVSRTDFSGFFSMVLRPGVKAGRPIILNLTHPGYAPLELKETVGDELYVARMKSTQQGAALPTNHPEVVVGNILIRYSTENTSAVNIGSGVKIFDIANKGNVPCDHARVCSPDGKWKAAVGTASLDAGAGNEFRNARLSCVAGPCPFTRIDSDGFSGQDRTISVAVRNWSDSTTFVLQAEVFRLQNDDLVREYYPAIIGRTINFTLPSGATGLSVEAEVDGTSIEFPLGPDPVLSWADCNVSVQRDRTKVYRCELKPWCKFR
jgi:hypothetical protein